MKLVFIYGPPAAGKLTIARKVSEQTGLSLFHNHLIVDAVGAVFPFGSEQFRRLREKFWFETFEAALQDGRSLIFTFLPEQSVSSDFAYRVLKLVADQGGEIVFVKLDLSREGQLDRLANADRGKFGKLRDTDLLEVNFDQMEASIQAMPEPDLVLNTGKLSADAAARQIVDLIKPAS
ncbi:MAG: AAA family ATPase [Pseudomonadota bacterium]|nr:AAA family ATPase [Pseudomonadota bacterium]